MTIEASNAFDRASVSRRAFLTGSGILIVGFTMTELSGPLGGMIDVAAQRLDGASSNRLDAWLAIAEDGRVTAYTGKCEFGQGLYTAQTQLVAEELCVPLWQVTLVQCDTTRTPDQGTTSGSQSHPTNFNQRSLAQAAATAREALLGLAVTHLGVPADRLTVRDGIVSVTGEPSRSVTYGSLIGGKQFDLTLNANAKRKPQTAWTVLGTSVPRIELPDLVTARFEHVHNVRVPGMLHGRVVRPPAVGAALISVNESSVTGVPGFVKLVVKKNFVGVVTEKPWQAIQAARQLEASWTEAPPLPAHATFYDHLRGQTATRDAMVLDSKDVDAQLAKASAVVKATYYHPYQMHGSLGSSCAVADVQGDRATIWSPTQSLYAQRGTLATLLGLSPENVRVIYREGSGCYGLNGADTVSYDAALLSQGAGKPVRVQLMRADEMGWENYGVPYVIDQRLALDAQGTIIAWDYEAWSAELGGRPGNGPAATPGTIITGTLAGFPSPAFTPRSPAPPPSGPLRNARNDAPSYVTGCIDGVCEGTGTIKSERVLTHTSRSLFFTGPLRSPNRLQNTFAHEGILDEAAARAKVDPVEYRLRHLKDPRLIAVVKAAAKGAAWDTRPSPKSSQPKTGWAPGRGIACVLYEGDNGYGALVAHAEVNQDTGEIRVKRFVAASDCGPISNPDGLTNQIEGGALQGLSRALLEEVVWDDHKVTSVDWRSYRSLSVGADFPAIDSILINQSEGKAMGAGETIITLVAGALGNAIFDATGARVRQVPFTPDRIKAAIAARS
jgi:nicotinate dehydrogenase subunit B